MAFYRFFSPIEKFDIVSFSELSLVSNDGFFPFLDFSLTNMSLYLVFVFFTVVFFLIFPLYDLNFLPSFLQNSLEEVFAFIFSVLEKQVGNKGYVYFPFVFNLFLFILFSNLYGITPFSFAPTSHVVITFFFSMTVWFMATFLGLLENGLGFYKLFVPNVPLWMLPVLVIIEIASYVIRVFSLAIRLSANITSGHVLLFTIAGFVIKLLKFSFLFALFAGVLLVFVFMLEFGIAFLQAYVFITLACIYFNDSLNLSH